jgi:hypothetical protein
MKRILLLVLFVSILFNSFAGQEPIPSGSFIVNLGVTPQTAENGLKPYGMVYEMLQTLHVPVKWVINSSKLKDEIDFTYNNVAYKGGSFVILAKYRTGEVNAAISKWVTSGVVGVTTTSEITVEVYATLTYAPRWTLDKQQGTLVTPFFFNAGIPTSAYGGATSSGWKNPADLTECDDIFAMPHSDPTYATHSNLLAWNRDFKGAIWAGCHAASVMENIGLKFLTTNGMVPYGTHSHGTPPYTYTNPVDPIMQFMGNLDGAVNDGSERIYLPSIGSAWLTGVKLSVTDPDHPQMPVLSPGPATVVAYGRGYGDDNRGYVMYQGGHTYNPTNSAVAPTSAQVALQRAFFNFAFLAIVDRQKTAIAPQIVADASMDGGTAYPVKFTVPAGIDISQYKIKWSASSGTILPDSTSRDITFTPSTDLSVKIALISLVLTDACGRSYFTTFNVNVGHCTDPAFIPDITIAPILADDQRYTASVVVPSTTHLSSYTVKWSVSSGTIIGSDTSTSVSYFPSFLKTVNSVTINLVLTNACGVAFTTQKLVPVTHVLKNEGRVTPVKLISPNGDGLGYDFLYLENIELYPENEVTIYNRWGNVVYRKTGYDNDIVKFVSKNMSGEEVTNGVFYYLIKINSANVPKESASMKGFFILKR